MGSDRPSSRWRRIRPYGFSQRIFPTQPKSDGATEERGRRGAGAGWVPASRFSISGSLLECWNAGMLECWNAGMLECWNAGMLECWRSAISDQRSANGGTANREPQRKAPEGRQDGSRGCSEAEPPGLGTKKTGSPGGAARTRSTKASAANGLRLIACRGSLPPAKTLRKFERISCTISELPSCSRLTPETGIPDAGWSSLVARQAHNLKVVGSNPAPATNLNPSSLTS